MHNQTLDLPALNESLSAVIELSSLTGWLLENKKCSHISHSKKTCEFSDSAPEVPNNSIPQIAPTVGKPVG